MPEKEVSISITCNNSEIEKILLENKIHSEIKFVNHKKDNNFYHIFFIDLAKDLTHVSQDLIQIYSHCRKNDSKLGVVILHKGDIDIEKNHYFQKMLDDLGGERPLHRLIYTKDLYQTTSSIPATFLDIFLYEAITLRKINISKKGENLLFPLSLHDFVDAVVKSLFLSNTSGKNIWVLGDSLSDLELSYLLKKITAEKEKDELEINANNDNDPKSITLQTIGNKTRIDLNWQPKNEIIDDLKKIVALYTNSQSVEQRPILKENPIHTFINWLYKPRQKKETRLPTIKNILKKVIVLSLEILLILIGTFVIVTGISLKQIENSTKEALNGNLNKSVSILNSSMKFKEVGESILLPLSPLTNIVSPNGTEKLFNLYSFIGYAGTSLKNLQQTYVIAENLLHSLNNPETKINYADLSLALHSNLSQVYENLSQINFLSSKNKLPVFLNKRLKENSQFNNLSKLESQIAQFIKVTDIIPAILSGDKPKTLLLLLQNSQLLQPNGGATDFYLLITIKNGELISKKYFTEEEINKLYQDVDSIQNKNKRFSIATPLALKKIAQDPDFSKASNNISSYFEKATKVKLDFVIAINDILLQNLLLEEKSEIVNNFKMEIVTSSGSAIYKDLADQYLERLFNHDISLPVIGRTLAKTIGDNHIFIWSADKNTERLISSQSFSGVIYPHSCSVGLISGQSCQTETTYLSESFPDNLRQNLWESRQVKHTINITGNSIDHEYQIDYKPHQTTPIYPSIQTTFHLYLPSSSTLNQILLNGLPSSMGAVEKVIEGSFDHYIIPQILSNDQNATIVIKATTKINHTVSLPYSYSITEYRQPGTLDSGITLKISYPENLRVFVVTSPFTANPSQMSLDLPRHTSTFGFTLVENKK